ncbi:hypothetical protein GOBAR_AA13607 [Gossypium barbadense]|uniref:Uncharacterized protein n=1 Tax=Gossypium barbadense TaxID=3634 RepID=A0A2P5XUK5_GOSBA|nr:hypothetical protein GOBAR_AA13607 [Gossypium barbadense]
MVVKGFSLEYNILAHEVGPGRSPSVVDSSVQQTASPLSPGSSLTPGLLAHTSGPDQSLVVPGSCPSPTCSSSPSRPARVVHHQSALPMVVKGFSLEYNILAHEVGPGRSPSVVDSSVQQTASPLSPGSSLTPGLLAHTSGPDQSLVVPGSCPSPTCSSSPSR